MPKLRYWYGIYRKAFGKYTLQLIAIVVMAFVTALLEGLGISAIVPMFSFISGKGGMGNDIISQAIAAGFAFLNIEYTFRLLILFVAILFVVRTLFIFFIRLVTARIVYGYERDLRRMLFQRTLASNWMFLSKQKIGNLEQLLTTNTSNASQFFNNITGTVIVAAKILVYIAIAINLSLWVAILSFACGILIFFALRPVFRRERNVSMATERINREMAHFVGEHVIGMKAVKAMALEQPVGEKGAKIFEERRRLNLRSILLRSYVELFVQFAAVIFIGLTFTIMYKSEAFSFAAFGVIVFAVSQIFAQVQAGQLQLHTLITMFPYISEAFAYADRTRESEEPLGGGDKFSIERSVSFRNVSFSYPDRGTVLSRANVEIRRGELVGLVGPSGSGKTTFADLLLRLYEPTDGAILADGSDIREIPLNSWRTHVGYVAQDPVLLNDTIEENIRFYNERLSHEEAKNAARLAHIADFIESLPKKYDTVIGDRGVLLSGGQRQRVALARVLARKPVLLVLDEATSALDRESETAIHKSIDALHGTVTVVVIAHRVSTIRSADRILAIEDGLVKEKEKEEYLRKESLS